MQEDWLTHWGSCEGSVSTNVRITLLSQVSKRLRLRDILTVLGIRRVETWANAFYIKLTWGRNHMKHPKSSVWDFVSLQTPRELDCNKFEKRTKLCAAATFFLQSQWFDIMTKCCALNISAGIDSPFRGLDITELFYNISNLHVTL